MSNKQMCIIFGNGFDVKVKNGAIVSLKYYNDLYNTEYIWEGKRFGDIFVTFRKIESDWIKVNTSELAKSGQIDCEFYETDMWYSASYIVGNGRSKDITINVDYLLCDKALLYTIKILNNSIQPVEIGDLAIPFPMNSSFAWGKNPTECVIRHSFVSGHNSYMFWTRCNGVGPYLVMTPVGNTKLEYFDMYIDDISGKRPQYRAYIHSAFQGQIAKQKGCKWRQPNTSIILAPNGLQGDSVSYTFKFQWAPDYEGVRKIIVKEGLIDIQVIPGMTVPENLYAMFYLKTKLPIHSVDPEFPFMTQLEYLGEKEQNLYLYKVKFSKLGENLITVRYGDNKWMILEFFVTEPIETLIEKRAAFITKCQHRDPQKWYNGLISEWNMETQVLLGPDNYDRIKGWRIYAVSCDDPGLSKPAFLAAKNVEYPVQKEVEALDYYIEHFVWGGLQRTNQEEYSYGIYGIPDWRVNRYSEDEGPCGKLHIWRIYDYPHVILLYFSMYKIAKNYPHIKTLLSAETYLERAYRTALALFTIPFETGEWSAYNTGLYNELVIEDLINEMYALGWQEKAYRLQRHWLKKVRFFINENPDIFGSEYPYDTTGFESTHAFAKYALMNSVKSIDEDLTGDEKNI